TTLPNLLADQVDHLVHQLRVESEDDDLRVAEGPEQADAVGEGRSLVVLGDHDDMPADLFDVRDELMLPILLGDGRSPLPRLAGSGTGGDPAEGEVGQFEDAGVQPGHLPERDKGRLFNGDLASVQELPAAVILIVRDPEDRGLAPDDPLEGEDGQVLGVYERRVGGHGNLPLLGYSHYDIPADAPLRAPKQGPGCRRSWSSPSSKESPMGLFLSMSGVARASWSDVEDALSAYAKERGGLFQAAEGPFESPNVLAIAEGKAQRLTVLYPWEFVDWDDASAFLSS